MRRVNAVAATAAVVLAALSHSSSPASAQAVAYEGVRLIVGDGRVVENATLVVDGARIVQAGAGVSVPAGATRVNLAGKTAMPAIVDTHVHLSATRERLTRDLKLRGYWGVGAAMSMGTDNLELLPMRNEVIPGAARFLSAGRGITRKEPMRPTHQIETEDEGRKAVRDNAALGVQIIKVWVDDREGKVQKVTPEQYAAVIDEANKAGIRVTAHIFNMDDAKGLMRAGLHAFAHGVRDKDVDDETVAMFKARPNLVLTPNLPERGVKVDRSWMQPGMAADEFAKLEAEQCRPAGGADVPRDPGPQSREDERSRGADRDGHRRQPAVGRARGDGGHGAGRDDAGAGDRGIDPQRRRIPAARRRGHARGRQERRLHRARRKSAGRHQEHAQDLGGLSARRGRGPVEAGSMMPGGTRPSQGRAAPGPR